MDDCDAELHHVALLNSPHTRTERESERGGEGEKNEKRRDMADNNNRQLSTAAGGHFHRSLKKKNVT